MDVHADDDDNDNHFGGGSIQEERTRLVAPSDADLKGAAGASPGQAYFNTVTSFIGVGIYTLPYAFSLMGLWSGMVLMGLLGIIGVYVITLQIESLRMTELKWPRGHEITYSTIGQEAFGRFGVVLVGIAVVTSQLGFCCAYLIFIGDTLRNLFATFNTAQYVGIVLPAVVLLVLLRDLRVLSPVSLMANIVFLMAITSLLVYGFRDYWDPAKNQYDFVRATWPIGFGNAVFSMSGINLAIPIHASMRKPTSYLRVAYLGVLTVTVMYIAVGSLGYVFFGDSVANVVIDSLPDVLYVEVLQGLLALQILFTYPLQMFPVVQMTESALKIDGDMVSWRETKRNIVRLCLVGLTALLATQIPLFALVSALVGAFATSMAIFLLPTAIHSKLFLGKVRPWKIVLNGAIFLLGLAAAGVSSYYIIVQIVECLSGSADESQC